VDFWDLTALIFRRWRISLPLLLLSIGATLYIGLTAEPDYTMTSYVQLIPAKALPTDDPASASLRNPWNQLGLSTLGQASIYATQDQEFLDALKAGGHTENFTLTLTYPDPIVTVEVVGKTRADARETTQLVIDRLQRSAASLQKGSAVRDPDMIATQRLDQGQNLLPSRSKVKRAILAVAAAGLVLTAGGTVGFDALARRRARLRVERESASAERADSPEVSATSKIAAVGSAPGAGPSGSGPPALRQIRAAPPAAAERTAIVVQRTARLVKRPPAEEEMPAQPPAAAMYRSVNAQNNEDSDDHEATSPATNGEPAAVSSEVRVVLKPNRIRPGR
jgi:hypothetical protein